MNLIRSHDYRGYDEIVKDGVGIIGYVDRRTGNTTDVVYQPMPMGSGVLTPAQVERNRQYGLRQQERLRRGAEPNFYFTVAADRREVVKPETIARLFFLASFLGYNDNRLYLSERTDALKKSDLPELLRLSKSQFYRFWDEVDGKYLTKKKDGTVEMIGGEFFRGAISRRHRKNGDDYQRVFIESMQELYRQTDANQHKDLGRLFALLPFVNHEWNVLCSNPDETDLNRIRYLTLPEFCRMVGWNPTNTSRVFDAYRRLIFTWDGKPQRVCAYLINRLDRTERLIINPVILYRGEHIDRVRSLAMFFDPEALDSHETPENEQNVV